MERLLLNSDFCYYNKPDVLLKYLNPVLDCLIKQDPEAIPFREPVDPEVLNVPDYFKIIKEPMDLSTIRNKLSTGQYKNSWEFIDDVWLMFRNAQLYNKKSSRVYKYCSKLIRLFKSIIDEPMIRLGHCCGQIYKVPPKLLVCSSQKDCVIPKFVHYWSYDNRFQLCKQCFSEIEGDFVVIHCVTGAISIKKDDFVENFHDEEKKEPFIECFNCGIKVHQICVLFLKEIWKEGYLCDNCLNCLSKVRVRNTYTSENLLKTNLSTYIEEWVNNFLNNKGCNSKVIVRLVYNGNKKVEVKKCAKKRFVDNGIWPESFPYTTKTILAFQKNRDKDICFFAMFVQEYDMDCPQPNARRVYISYLDSIHFFTPRELRSAVYHEMLLGYFDYVRKKGFTTIHLWSCPSKKGEDYVFYNHPDDQKHPTIKKLIDWYKVMLDKGITDGIVKEYKDIYKYVVENNIQNVCELPYFEGDILPLSLEKEISKLEGTVNGKVSSSFIKKTALSLLNKKEGENIYESKDEMATTAKTSKSKKTKLKKSIQISCPSAVDTLTERIFKFFFQFKQVFLVIQLLKNLNGPKVTSNITPDPLISSQLMHSREEFLEFCRDRNYLFSSLRHAKFSTMILLYELINEKIDVCHCNQCNKVIKTGFHCSFCKDFDLCIDCYSNVGHNHEMEDFRLSTESKSYISIHNTTGKKINGLCKNLRVLMNKNNQLIRNESTSTLDSECHQNFSNGFLAINNSISSSIETNKEQLPSLNKYETKFLEGKNSNINSNGYLEDYSVICTSTSQIYNQSNQITSSSVSNDALHSLSYNSISSSIDFSRKHETEVKPFRNDCSPLHLVKLSKVNDNEKESTFPKEANARDPNLQSENPFLTALLNQNDESFTPLLPPNEVNENLKLFTNLPYNEKSDIFGCKSIFDHNYTASEKLSVSSEFNANYEHSAAPDISQNVFTPHVSTNAIEEPLFKTLVNKKTSVNKNAGFSLKDLLTFPNDTLDFPFASYPNPIQVERTIEKPMDLVNSKCESFSAISINQSCSSVVSFSEASCSKETMTYPVWSTVNDFSSKLPTVTSDNLADLSENFYYKKTAGSTYESSITYSQNNELPQTADGFLADSNIKEVSAYSKNMPIISKVSSPALHPAKIALDSNLRTFKRKYENIVAPNAFDQETSSGGLNIKRILLSQNQNSKALDSPILSSNPFTSDNVSPNYSSSVLNTNECLLPNAINDFQLLNFKIDCRKASACQPVSNIGDSYKLMENGKERQSYEMTSNLSSRVSSVSSKNIVPINYCEMSANKGNSEELFSPVNDHLVPTFFNTKSDNNTSKTHEMFQISPASVSIPFRSHEISNNQHIADSRDKFQNCLKIGNYVERISNNNFPCISETSLVPLSSGKIITNHLSHMQPFQSELVDFSTPVGQIKTSAVNNEEKVQVPNYTTTNSFIPFFSENGVVISKHSQQNQFLDFLQSNISPSMTDKSQSLCVEKKLITKNSVQSSSDFQNVILSRNQDDQNLIFQNDLNTGTKSFFNESNNLATITSTSTKPTYLIITNSNADVISDYSSNFFSSGIETPAKTQISLQNDQNSVSYAHLNTNVRSITAKKNANASVNVPVLIKPTYLSFDKNENEIFNLSSKISSFVAEENKIKTQVPIILVSKAAVNVSPRISTSNASSNLALNNPKKSFSYVLTDVPSHWRPCSGIDSNGNFKANANQNKLLSSGKSKSETKSEVPKKQLNRKLFLSKNKTVRYVYCTEKNVNYSQVQSSVNNVSQTALFLQQPQDNSDTNNSSQLTPAKRQNAARKNNARKKKLV